MTPSEMRKRAWRNLKSAGALLQHGDADKAAYLAGEAAELSLKARYCVTNGLSQLPATKRELADHKLLSHNLERLLRLSDAESIQRGALDSIDWQRVAEWDNEDRYKPVGTVTAEVARSRVDQTALLFQSLVQYEIVEALVKVVIRKELR